MVEALNLEGFRGAKGRVRCFPHILNLAVKVSLYFRYNVFLSLTKRRLFSHSLRKI
jgi:hypothetical protein